MHIVVLPAPLQGHVNPCLAVARLLIPQGFTFTFVLTEDLAGKLHADDQAEAAENPLNASSIQYAAIALQQPSPTAPPNSRVADPQAILETIDRMRPGFETLLHKLIPSPSLIIADTFFPWASEFHIPVFFLCATNAHALTAVLRTQILISKGIVPVKDPKLIVDCVPGLAPMRAGDLPDVIRKFPALVADRAKVMQKAAGLIINTVYELEREPLQAINCKVPIYSIGPMLLMQRGSDKSEKEQTIGLWREERGCLKWLASRPASSVLLIAFGSMATLRDDQIKELAEGLEASGHAFLWVIHSNAVEMPLLTLLPEGFTERTKDRGLIISWAPQVEVLSHPAVGGFLTHCGWNSITENLALGGVPMICWPQQAEQRLNKLLLVNKWRVGLELQEEEGGFVKRAEVEKAVTQLMQGEVGKELKKRVLELKRLICLAVQEGGSSHNHLQALGQDIKKLGSTV